MTHDIAALWRRIDTALARHAPAVLDSLAGPAKAATLARLEAELGAPLPDDLKSSWAIRDGQDADAGDDQLGLFGDFPWLSVAAVRAERKEMRELAKTLGQLDQGDDFAAWHALVADGIGFIDGPVKARDYHPLWIPIGSFDAGVFRYVDLDPAPGGRVGQVIEIDVEGLAWRVLAPSFADLLARFADALEAGELDWTDPDTFAALFPRGDGGMPAWLREHAPTEDTDEPAPADGGLARLGAGESATFAVEITRIIGVAPGAHDLRLQIDGEAKPIWAQATQAETKGFKQAVMRARGQATLVRRPGTHVYEDGEPPQFVVERFVRQRGNGG
jgi:cell wall assembly regulator SMI1